MLYTGEPRFYLDRCFLSELPKEIASAMESLGLILQGEVKRISFVGVILIYDSVNVFLPRSSVLPLGKINKYQVASHVMLAIEKYGRSSDKTLVNQSNEGLGHKNMTQLTLLKDLLADFMQNGIYSKRKQIRRINQGKTDWKKTINSLYPFIDKDSRPVYIDNFGINKEYFSSCEIAKIHAEVIRSINRNLSWLLLGASHLETLALSEYQKPSGDIDCQISQLRQEIAITYSDRDIRLLGMLVDFLETLTGMNRSPFAIGLTKFHFCWEAMLASVLEFVEPVNSKLPIPVYINADNEVLAARDTGLRTDIFMYDRTNKIIAVVDAKYYAATKAKDSPGWRDIVKQLFYVQAIESMALNTAIKNIFVFPGNENNIQRVVLKNRGTFKQENLLFAEKFKPIYCYYVDPLSVVENYVKNKKMSDFSFTLLHNNQKLLTI
jgi:hypothetical protein